MANSADPDQLASSDLEAKWSGFTLFPKEGYIRVLQDKGYDFQNINCLQLFNYFLMRKEIFLILDCNCASILLPYVCLFVLRFYGPVNPMRSCQFT